MCIARTSETAITPAKPTASSAGIADRWNEARRPASRCLDLNFASEQCQIVAENQMTATSIRISASGDSARARASSSACGAVRNVNRMMAMNASVVRDPYRVLCTLLRKSRSTAGTAPNQARTMANRDTVSPLRLGLSNIMLETTHPGDHLPRTTHLSSHVRADPLLQSESFTLVHLGQRTLELQEF